MPYKYTTKINVALTDKKGFVHGLRKGESIVLDEKITVNNYITVEKIGKKTKDLDKPKEDD